MPDTFRSYDLEMTNLPYNLEAEQSVLGAILLDKDCISSEGVDKLRSEYFYLPQHKLIFEAMYSLYTDGRPLDIVTILEELRATGRYDSAGGKQYLTQLAQLVPSVKNVKSYADIVLEKFYVRSLMIAAKEIISDASDPTNEAGFLLDNAEQKIYDIRAGKDSSGLRNINNILVNDTFKRINALNDPEKREEYIGIPTGLEKIDKITAGLNKTDLVIIGARPGTGKTSIMLNMARNIAVNHNKSVAVFSLEMSCDQLAQRLLSAEASIPSERFRSGDFKGDEWERLVKAGNLLGKAPIYLDDTAAITVPEIKSKLRRKKVDVCFIDYLQLMSSPKPIENRVQEITAITRNLKIMAKELEIPVVIASQLNRGPTSKDGKSRKPLMSDLRDSGSIEQDADEIFLLHRPDPNTVGEDDSGEATDPNIAEFIIAKNRHGSTGSVKLYWEGEYTRYSSLADDEYDR
ncbi:MAG: replicative DNA helicase [Acutalibacteraceae bacterium]